MKYNIAVLPGDGIGPEIIAESIKVLNAVAEKFKIKFSFKELLIGGAAIDAGEKPLPAETLIVAKNSHAVLLGAVGGPKWEHLAGADRPEKGLLEIREGLELFANLRPAILYEPLAEACPLKKEKTAKGLDLIFVRELTGGIYFGERGMKKERGIKTAYDIMLYDTKEIERIGKVAFEIARKRNKKLTSVDKANVLETSRLWREIMHKLATENTDIEYEDMLVDNAAMQLVNNPSQFDVIVTENMFGDILSDEASMLTGSIGMLASASIGATDLGMYEPSHGSAPDIAGQQKANPLAAILSAAMLLRHSLHLEKEALAIENAIEEVLAANYRTPDIANIGDNIKSEQICTTQEMGDAVANAIKNA